MARNTTKGDSDIMQVLSLALDHDRYAARIVYTDARNRVTNRTISPIRWEAGFLFAICLGREEPRTFKIENIMQAELVDANDVLAPVTVEYQ